MTRLRVKVDPIFSELFVEFGAEYLYQLLLFRGAAVILDSPAKVLIEFVENGLVLPSVLRGLKVIPFFREIELQYPFWHNYPQ